MIKHILKISIFIAIFFMSEFVFGQDQNKIVPGVQWDTAIVIKPKRYPEHLIGIRYDYSFSGLMMTPKMKKKGVNAPVNLAILYTFYHPLWDVYNYFGLQTGVRMTQYGFCNVEYAFEHFEETITSVEMPFLSAFHIDIGKYFRVLFSIGPFLGYRIKTTKDNSFDCFDNRIDYGIVGGAGVAFRLGKIIELHLEGAYHYSLSMLFNPEKLSSDWWIYTYPWQASINFGVHFKLK